MFAERFLEIARLDGEKRIQKTLSYYISVSEPEENEFSCRMYNIGIRHGERECVVENFCSDETEARDFLDILYNNSVSADYLISFAEEYVSRI